MDEATATAHTDNPVILSSRVIGTPVFNSERAKIGHVHDLSIEKTSGRAIFAILSFGGFLGIGEKFHPVPWTVLHYDTALGGFVVPVEKAELAAAPQYDRDELRALGGADYPRHREQIHDHYSAPFI
jgi:hypothetical protein